MRHDRSAVNAALARHSAETPAPADTRARDEGARSRPWFIDEEDAKLLFAVSTRGQRYDAFSAYVHKPNLESDVNWPEHPRGHWRYRTNSVGLREDGEIRTDQPDLRVIVTGDSHVEGYCDNADAYPHVLGASLARALVDSTVEVLNAADGGYSFHNYAGVLAQWKSLAPNVFVVTVHGGNDFKEVLLPHRYFARLPPEPEDDVELAAIARGEAVFVAGMFQGLTSVLHFHRHPADIDVALAAAFEVFDAMKRECDAAGIALVCVYLPSPVEVERVRFADRIEPDLRAIGLEASAIEDHAEIGRRFVRGLTQRKIRTIDATDALRSAVSPCFWGQDLHLNLLGHQTLARIVEPVVLELARRKR